VTASVTLLVLPLVEGREHGWPAWTWCCLLASPVLASAFVRQQLRRRRESPGGRGGRAPLIDLALFRERSFSVGSLTAMAFGLVAPSFFFILALYLQQGRGYSALFSGTVFMAVGTGYFAAMLVATAVAERIGVQVLAVGALLVAAGCVLLAETAHASSSPPLLPGLAVVGFGIGLVLVPLSSTVLAGVDPAQAGAASGALATAQQIGAAIGVAVIGTIFFASGPIVHGFVVCLWLLAGIAGLTLALAQFLGPGESGS
jgi:predicted MFS family arabinose efflux permease